MGKLIRMGTQERLLLRPKRLRWSRFLFLLGMLIIVSTYQHLRSPQGLPSLWAGLSSQHPVKLASRDLPNEMMTGSSDPPKATSEMEGETLTPQATMGKEEVTPGITMENTPNTPRTTANTSPTIPKNSYSSTAAGSERVKENTPTAPSRVLSQYTSTASRSTAKNHTPTTPRGEVKPYPPTPARGKVKRYTPSPPGRVVNAAPSTFTEMARNHGITPRTTVQDSETVATYQTLETSPSKQTVEETTPTTLKGVIDNTPTFLISDIETNILTSPRSLAEKSTLTTPRRMDSNSSPNPRGLVGKDNLMTSQGLALEHTAAISEGQVVISTRTGSGPAATQVSTAAWMVRNPWSKTTAPTMAISLTTFWGLAKKPSTAQSTSAAPSSKADPTTQVRHCVVVEPAPAMPTPPAPSLTTGLLPEAPSPSPSVLAPSQPDHHPKAEYPPDLFSLEERRQGWVVLHIFGMMYVFVALAIVCDEYFVPALGVITDKLQISEDVAGATFMAAGGSAPELFTSLIGVFISHSNVGIGTIVGSAVFNILFVIGTCALFSREILNLTWWPLFRDVSFYILDLMMLILFFLDSLIVWWESLLLLLAYAFYVFTMKWNKKLELWMKEQLNRRPVAKVMALGDFSKLTSVLTRGSSSASLHNSTIRSTIYWLMLHSLDLGEAHSSKNKDEESLNQEAKVEPQAKAESKPEEEEPAKPPAVTVTPAPAPDVQGDQQADPGSQDGAAAGAESTGETAGGGGEAPGKGQSGQQSGGEPQLEGEGEIETKGKGDNEGEGELQTEGDDGEVGGEETEEQEADAEHQGEAESDEKGADGEGGGAGSNGKDEVQAESKGNGEGEGELPAGEDGKVKGDEGETEEQEANAEHQGEAKSDEKSTDGEGGGAGGGSEDEEEEEDEDEDEDEEEEEEEENEEPLSLEWPETPQKQAIYLFLLPIVFPLWLTVPDVRRPESKKFFVITFLGSIVWIATFSYLMVWWAHQVGETIGISEEIMGLTILAAGTSIPDLITSVIVARKGLGDMAVSSSVGSNIFDITVGLPVPWLLFSLINGLQPVPVSSNGLFCAIVLLFLMLLFVISSIASCKWRMNKILGFTMFLLYFVFLVISVMLEDRIISCPVSI
ncbi:sodium/potassium/calcium exchanger 1 isoform X1 [Sturnira hondurensis]|uniref:sodium/potassium/calcium exchanger 1 isoform X1 n=1 Tax=Sturnira hondurensis TaxID=192404 RepID=UPI0018797BFE|nr:sodium/potassium/calcium exchanger 1 isoform X1 [Sturnira hondurensis]